MLDYFSTKKQEVQKKVISILEEKKEIYMEANKNIGFDFVDRYIKYTNTGKMIRACLVSLGFEMCSSHSPTEQEKVILCECGAAMEIFQSAILIHDDIMDQDDLRRGNPSFHTSYTKDLEKCNYKDSSYNGMSLAICASDIGFFTAFNVISELNISEAIKNKCLAFISTELSKVGIAQMKDLLNAAVKEQTVNVFAYPNENEKAQADRESILLLYKYKTARYTFSLPLALGAIIANADKLKQKQIEELGINLGLLFQIKDDELGLFADEKKLGKSIGIDIKDDKKTLYRLSLFEKAPKEQKAKLLSIFGNSNINQEDIDFVRKTIIELGIKEELENEMKNYAKKATEEASFFNDFSTEEAKKCLLELINYSLTRKS